MKKIILLFSLALIIQVTVFSQPCLPEGIIFTTQEQIDNFQSNYPNCTEIEGDVSISGIDIINLSGLNSLNSIGGHLVIDNNPLLYNFTGLENLNTIGGAVSIMINESLLNFEGLENLTLIGNGLEIIHNSSLQNISQLNNLTSIGAGIYIMANNSLINLIGLENLTTIEGPFLLGDSDWGGNPSLINMTGLNNVTSIAGDLIVYGNDSLLNLEGLNSLTFIDGTLQFKSNNSLLNLDGLDNLKFINGNLSLELNHSLNSLSHLNELDSINGGIYINNNNLISSLLGLDNIAASSITEISITNNNSLSACAISSICNYLANPTGPTIIEYNETGCNSLGELEEVCDELGITDSFSSVRFSIYPNPVTNKLNITSNSELKIGTVKIYNQLGQIVLNRNDIKEFIDISSLGQGIYIIELTLNKLKVRQKLMIK